MRLSIQLGLDNLLKTHLLRPSNPNYDGVSRQPLSSGNTITTTPAHRFHVEGKGFTPSAHLRAGDCITSARGLEGVALRRIDFEQRNVDVYNLSVAQAHTYFVGE